VKKWTQYLNLTIETYRVTKIEVNPYNEIVPYKIFLDNRAYIPTSAHDGRWEDSMHLGAYELIKLSMERIKISKERTSFNDTLWHFSCGGILEIITKDNKKVYRCKKCKQII